MEKNLLLKKISAVVIGLIIFVLMVVLGFRIFGTRAADTQPQDVVISNIERNSVRINWTTGVDTQGVIEYGTSATALNFFAPEAEKTKNHSVDLTLLSPTTTYYFVIRIGEKRYDNGGVPWTFTTKGVNDQPAVQQPSPTSKVLPNTQNLTPTPFQSLRLDDVSQEKCKETDCEKIKEKLGKGCTTQDYFLCIKKLTPTVSQ